MIGNLIFISACSHHSDLETFNRYYYNGQDKEAYEYAKSKGGKNGDVLWNLQAGISAFTLNTQDSRTFLETLEQGEMLFSRYEAEGLMGGVIGNMGAVLVNENVKAYRGSIYEGVMFNYYKALYAMSQGNSQLARVEFNRANDRQRRAKEYFRKDIQKALEAEAKQNAQDSTLSKFDLKDSQSSISPILESQYSNLKQFSIYKDFINPAISYVSALFFMLEGDYAKSMDLYKESYAINHAPIINQDLQILQNRKNTKKTPKYTWLIIEDGKSASKYDISLDLPLYYINSNILHVGVSIPKLALGEVSAKSYQAEGENGVFSAYEISDIDGVIANEFQNQLPFILTRAITSAILKASTQSILNEHLGATGALAGMLYSMLTTSADIRISSALPKRILAMQIPNYKGDFMLKVDNQPIYYIHFTCDKNGNSLHNEEKNASISLCQNDDNIVYLRNKGKNLAYRILTGAGNE